MSTPIEVRPARPGEFDAVAELTAGIYLAEGWGDEHYEPVLRDTAGRAEQARVLVAVDRRPTGGSRIVGAVTVATRGGRYAELAGPGDAVVRMLVTEPAARGRGTGTALMRACLDTAAEDGCTRVLLSTEPEMAAAHRLYDRLGFVRTPALDWCPRPGLRLLAYTLELAFCERCGERGEHPACRAAAALEPPRYCTRCRRRMVVQVTPSGWTARCIEHGTRRSPPAGSSTRLPG